MTLPAAQFAYLRDLVKEHSAVVLEPGSQELVESQLLPVALHQGFRSLHQFLRHLQETETNGTHELVIESIIADETSFFRDQDPFEALRTHLLPELERQRAGQRELAFWCAGCSTGQEAYSVAMILDAFFPQFQEWKVQLIASDFSSQRLARAQEGYFSQLEINTGLPVSLLVKYFQKIGPVWQVKPELRKRIDFCQMNLAGEWPSLPAMDVILIRNVLRYFDPKTKKKVLQAISQTLKPGGYLCLGAGENADNLKDLFEPVRIGKAVFYCARRPPETKPAEGLLGKYDLAPVPANVRRLATLVVNRDDGTIEEIIKVIDSDESLKSRLLRVANPSASSGLGLVTTVEQALVRAGMGSLIILVMGSLVTRALKKTSTTMFSMDLEEVNPSALDAEWREDIIGATQFSGKANGTIYIRFRHELGQKMAAHMTGIPAEEADSEMVSEVAKEMANMVVGNFRSNLTDAGLRCQLTVPSVAPGNSFQLKLKPRSQHEQLAFQHEGQMMVVDLVVDALG